MKKTIALASTLLLMVATGGVAHADEHIVPLRAPIERMGFNISWNDSQRMVTITRDGFVSTLTIGQSVYTINGQTKNFDAEPAIIDEKTQVSPHYIDELYTYTDPSGKIATQNWQTSLVTDPNGVDITEQNSGLVGLGHFDASQNRYEFFSSKTQQSIGDSGVYFVTQDGRKHVFISKTLGYKVIFDVQTLNRELYVYTLRGTMKDGSEGAAAVSHTPFLEELPFTSPAETYTKTTGDIDQSKPGRVILGNSLWTGLRVIDEQGNDVTEHNKNFMSVAKFDKRSNKYQFFNQLTGESKGDYGYFDVIANNRARVNISLGANYAATLEITELNKDKFTYVRMGKDGAGRDIMVYVEHIPYFGEFDPQFTF